MLTNGSIKLGRVQIFRDNPDDIRKLHKNPTPNTGGIAIGLSFAMGATVMFATFADIISSAFFGLLPFLIISASIIFITGIYDDTEGLTSGPKFATQILAGIIFLIGLDIHFVSQHIAFSEYSYVVRIPFYLICILWITACSNTVNLVDGIDGLAGTLSIVALLGISLIAMDWVVNGVLLLSLPLIAAVGGFLVFNRPPAKLFMGDTGSLFIGFMIGIMTIILAIYARHWMYSLALVLFMGIPLMDTVFSIIRRLKLSINPFESDNNHIHHILQRYFRGPGLAVLTLSTSAMLLAVIAILLTNTDNVPLFFGVYGVLFFLFVIIAVVYWAKLDKKSSLFLYQPDISETDEISEPRHILRSVFRLTDEDDDSDKKIKKTGSRD